MKLLGIILATTTVACAMLALYLAFLGFYFAIQYEDMNEPILARGTGTALALGGAVLSAVGAYICGVQAVRTMSRLDAEVARRKRR